MEADNINRSLPPSLEDRHIEDLCK